METARGLNRRVDALEQRADDRDPYLREARRIATELEVPVSELLAGADEVRRRVRTMQAAGRTNEQIFSAFAEELGMSVEEFERRVGTTADVLSA